MTRMTFKEYVIDFCFLKGMSLEDAESVFKELSGKDGLADMDGRWDESMDDYFSFVDHLLITPVKATALAWIDTNKPQASYRACFE